MLQIRRNIDILRMTSYLHRSASNQKISKTGHLVLKYFKLGPLQRRYGSSRHVVSRTQKRYASEKIQEDSTRTPTSQVRLFLPESNCSDEAKDERWKLARRVTGQVNPLEQKTSAKAAVWPTSQNGNRVRSNGAVHPRSRRENIFCFYVRGPSRESPLKNGGGVAVAAEEKLKPTLKIPRRCLLSPRCLAFSLFATVRRAEAVCPFFFVFLFVLCFVSRQSSGELKASRMTREKDSETERRRGRRRGPRAQKLFSSSFDSHREDTRSD